MKDDRTLIRDLIKRIGELDYIKTSDIPNIELYMDQVTTFMEEHLGSCKRHEEDKILTKTMINNYSKNDLLPPSNKKKYSQDHVIMLTLIYYFKYILSITDIKTALSPLNDNYFQNEGDKNLKDIYDRVCKLCIDREHDYVKDILSKYDASCKEFPTDPDDVDPEESAYIHRFSFLCMLGFDVYIKKVVMEALIDEMRAEQEAKNSATRKKKEPDKDKK
ncbi:MAG: DUF1836 domain-containing protein [Lachnospiraceae bacterium]|nr:DUF1836 domain-containing protein [Lachnospiraceae bacterium]